MTISVRVMDFGITSSNEIVRHNEDDSYTILLNARSATNVQRKAYYHALSHIMNGDLDNREMTADEIERLRH